MISRMHNQLSSLLALHWNFNSIELFYILIYSNKFYNLLEISVVGVLKFFEFDHLIFPTLK